MADDVEQSEHVATGAKRASDDGQDWTADYDDDDGHTVKRPRQKSDVTTEFKMLLPSKAVGAVIGNGGENIKRLRSEFSASLSIPDSEGPERILIIGATISSVCGIMSQLLTRLEHDLAGTVDSEELEVRMLVPQSHAGRIIGKGGERVKKFRADSGAHIKVYIQCCPHSTERVIQVSGQKDNVVSCLGMIMEDLSESPVPGINMAYNPNNADEDYSYEYGGYSNARHGGGPLGRPPFGGRGRGFGRPRMGFGGRFSGRGPRFGGPGMYDEMGYGGYGYGDYEGYEDEYCGYMDRGFGGGPRGRGGGRMMSIRGGRGGRGGTNRTTSQVSIPKFLAGAVIGKAGCRIKQIQVESGTLIKLDEANVEGDERVITITGHQDQIQYAQYLLQEAARGRGGRI